MELEASSHRFIFFISSLCFSGLYKKNMDACNGYYSGWLPTSRQQAARKEASFLLCTLFQGGLQADKQTRRPSFLRLRALLCSLRDFH